jgi:hypothetical protein
MFYTGSDHKVNCNFKFFLLTSMPIKIGKEKTTRATRQQTAV